MGYGWGKNEGLRGIFGTVEVSAWECAEVVVF